ncbi:MAG: hypothetical protein LUD47_05710 [Clostridia bacterium]|nr:hypothetical protein [Clostridia bacterium]
MLAGLSKDDETVITDNGKPVAFMMPIADDNFEETLSFMQRISAVNSLSSAQKKAVKDFPNGMSDEEIQTEIDAARKANTNDPEPVIHTIFKEAEHADIKRFYERRSERRAISQYPDRRI